MVADGVTNREAAARLFLSPKTIEVHLSRAYHKLGVRTRTELSRRMAVHRTADSLLAPARTLGTLLRTGAGPGDREVTAAVTSHGGRIVRAAGDGALAVFDAPSAALQCAFAVCAAARDGQAGGRAAVHVGEIESFPGGEIGGLAVQVVERMLPHAGTGEVLVTQTVRDTVYGSSLAFRSRGDVGLADAGNWPLFTAVPQ